MKKDELGKIIKAMDFSVEVRNMLDWNFKDTRIITWPLFSCEVQYQDIIHTMGHRTMRISIAKIMLPISRNNTPKIVEFKVREINDT